MDISFTNLTCWLIYHIHFVLHNIHILIYCSVKIETVPLKSYPGQIWTFNKRFREQHSSAHKSDHGQPNNGHMMIDKSMELWTEKISPTFSEISYLQILVPYLTSYEQIGKWPIISLDNSIELEERNQSSGFRDIHCGKSGSAVRPHPHTPKPVWQKMDHALDKWQISKRYSTHMMIS